MNSIPNYQNNTIESYIGKYIDDPLSLDQRQQNIKIIDDIVKKITVPEHKHYSGYQINPTSDIHSLEVASQTLLNNTLEKISSLLLQDKNTKITEYFEGIINKLLTAGAAITNTAEQNFYVVYTREMLQAKQRHHGKDAEIYIKRANKVSAYLNSGRILIEPTLCKQQKSIDKLIEQVDSLQKQVNGIDIKITRVENNQNKCCVIL